SRGLDAAGRGEPGPAAGIGFLGSPPPENAPDHAPVCRGEIAAGAAAAIPAAPRLKKREQDPLFCCLLSKQQGSRNRTSGAGTGAACRCQTRKTAPPGEGGSAARLWHGCC